jgi:hypothetical protein
MSIPSSLAVPDAASIISSTQAYDDESLTGVDALQVEKRYGEDRAKRLRDDGIEQFVDISLSDKFRHFQDDPWVDIAAAKDAQTMFPDNRCQMLILGAGFGGLLYAVRMIEGGVRPEDIRIVDSAGGFGGTWNYNRYPDLCVISRVIVTCRCWKRRVTFQNTTMLTAKRSAITRM